MNLRSIRVRLLAMTSVLSIGFAAYLLIAVATNYRAMQESHQLLAVSEVAVATSDLVHELQKERGILGRLHRLARAEVRRRTAWPAQAHRRTRAGAGRESRRTGQRAARAVRWPPQGSRRVRRTARRAPAAGERSGHLGQRVLRLLHAPDRPGPRRRRACRAEPVERRNGAPLHRLQRLDPGQGVHRAERATLNATFSTDLPMSDTTLHRLLGIVTNQNTHLDTFRAMSSDDELRRALDALLATDFSRNAAAMRKIALDSASDGNFGIVPGEWAATITRKIDAMKASKTGWPAGPSLQRQASTRTHATPWLSPLPSA
jgi:methyl-accepting chemotaxis protein